MKLASAQAPMKQGAEAYYAHAGLAGGLAIGADFLGRYLPVQGMAIYSDEFVFVEVAVFGPSAKKVVFRDDQFALELNGARLLPQAPGMVTMENNFAEMRTEDQISLDDGTHKIQLGGAQQTPRFPGDDPAHTPQQLPRVDTNGSDGQVKKEQRDPNELVRQVQFASGERVLPQAGFFFYRWQGKVKKIKKLALRYEGGAGAASLRLR